MDGLHIGIDVREREHVCGAERELRCCLPTQKKERPSVQAGAVGRLHPHNPLVGWCQRGPTRDPVFIISSTNHWVSLMLHWPSLTWSVRVCVCELSLLIEVEKLHHHS